MNTALITSSLVLSAVLLQGCAYRSHADNVYADADTQRAHSITMATVTAVRVVTIERAPTGVGGAAGANVGLALGGFAGKGNGQGSFVGSVLASVAGDLAGQAIESRVARLPGLEISMRLAPPPPRPAPDRSGGAWRTGRWRVRGPCRSASWLARPDR